MSDNERGAYTPPTDAPLSFDARRPVRGSNPAPVALLVGLIVLLGLAVAIFMFYRSGVRQAGQPPQTVGAPVGDLTAPPPAESQPQDPAAGLQIYKGEGAAPPPPVAPTFTAPPEQPQPRPQPSATVIPPPPPTVAATPTPAPAPALRQAVVASTPAAPPPPAPKAAPVPAPPAPAAKVVTPAPKAAPAKPEVVKAAPAKAEPAKAEPAKAAASGGAVVQIGAVSSTALADKAWSDAVAIAPGLAVGKGKSVEKIDKNGGVLYRTAVTGFASREAASAFCDKLKAAGKSCFVR